MNTTLTSLDRTSVKAIAEDITKALESVANKYGVAIKYKGGSFTASNCTYRIEVAVKGNDGAVIDRDREAFKTHSIIFGLNPNMLDQTFVHGGDTFKITGLSPRKHKFPVLAVKLSNGKGYKFPAHTIKLLLANLTPAL